MTRCRVQRLFAMLTALTLLFCSADFSLLAGESAGAEFLPSGPVCEMEEHEHTDAITAIDNAVSGTFDNNYNTNVIHEGDVQHKPGAGGKGAKLTACAGHPHS